MPFAKPNLQEKGKTYIYYPFRSLTIKWHQLGIKTAIKTSAPSPGTDPALDQSSCPDLPDPSPLAPPVLGPSWIPSWSHDMLCIFPMSQLSLPSLCNAIGRLIDDINLHMAHSPYFPIVTLTKAITHSANIMGR